MNAQSIDQPQDGTAWLEMEYKDARYALEFFEGQMRVWCDAGTNWFEVYDNATVMELIAAGRASNLTAERLERLQAAIRDLMGAWPDAPRGAKRLIVEIENEVSDLLSEREVSWRLLASG